MGCPEDPLQAAWESAAGSGSTSDASVHGAAASGMSGAGPASAQHQRQVSYTLPGLTYLAVAAGAVPLAAAVISTSMECPEDNPHALPAAPPGRARAGPRRFSPLLLGSRKCAAAPGPAGNDAPGPASLPAAAGSGDSDDGPAGAQHRRQISGAPPTLFFRTASAATAAAAAAAAAGPALPTVPSAARGAWTGGWSDPAGGGGGGGGGVSEDGGGGEGGVGGGRFNAGEAVDMDLHLGWATALSLTSPAPALSPVALSLSPPLLPVATGSPVEFSPAGRPKDSDLAWLGSDADDSDWSSDCGPCTGVPHGGQAGAQAAPPADGCVGWSDSDDSDSPWDSSQHDSDSRRADGPVEGAAAVGRPGPAGGSTDRPPHPP